MSGEPNVLLIVLDSVRARNTSLHGHHHETTPALDSLAEQATTYLQAKSPDRWSLPSHASIFTGLAVPEHGITQKGDRLESGHSVFADLKEEGYSTGVFSENPFLTELNTGLRDGFETVEGKSTEPLYPSAVDPHEHEGDFLSFIREVLRSERPLQSLANGVTTKLAWDYPELLPDDLSQRISGGVSRGDHYTESFLEWSEDQEGPWAACINYMDAHHPYSPRKEHNHWADDSIAAVLEDVDPYPAGFYTNPESMWRCEVAEYLYDGAIRQVDYEVGRIVETLENRDVLEETLVVITADHGDGFGELSPLRPLHIAGHAAGGHEVNFHVPLVVKYPGQDQSKQVTEPVSLTQFPDVVQTVRGGDTRESSDPFISDNPVVSIGSAPDNDFLKRVQSAGEETSLFEGAVEVVYKSTDCDFVRKHIKWGEEEATERIFDANTVVTAPSSETDIITRALDSFDRHTVRASKSDGQVAEDTKKRLERLGYR